MKSSKDLPTSLTRSESQVLKHAKAVIIVDHRISRTLKETLPVVDKVSTSKVIGSIIGINNVNKYSSCCTCVKKVTIKGKLTPIVKDVR